MVVAFSSGLAGGSRSGSFNPYSLILRSRVRVLIPRRSSVKLPVAAGLEQALLDRLAFQIGECGARYAVDFTPGCLAFDSQLCRVEIRARN